MERNERECTAGTNKKKGIASRKEKKIRKKNKNSGIVRCNKYGV